ncbi:MAG: SpoIIE family protein phosphatase [Candidatus Firestonebacteria bacterium]|nr:SpoIIE family protein phosphatase [Candidatus Firestonebacteria bacterium]
MRLPILLKKIFKGKTLEHFQLEVPAQEHRLGEIRDFITAIAQKAGFSYHEINNLKLALDEACSNVVRHAYKGMEPGTIRLDVDWRAGELDISIQDHGHSFDWKGSKTPDLNRYVEIGKKGGLGIWFIRKLMDETDYRTAAGANTLRLVKRTRQAQVKTAPGLPSVETTPATALGTAVALPEGSSPALPERRLSVKFKFLLPVVAVAAVLVLGIFTYMFRNQDQSMRAEIMTNAEEDVKRLANDAVNYLFKEDDLHLAVVVKTLVKVDRKLAYAFVLDKTDTILAHSQTDKMFQRFSAPAGLREPDGRKVLIQNYKDPNLGPMVDFSMPVWMGSLHMGTAHLGMKISAIEREIQTGRRNAVVIFLVVLVLSTAGVYMLIAFLVAPVQKIADGMLAISAGRLDHRISIQTDDEFGQMAKIFNDMTRRFSDAQSHLLEQERIQQEMQVAQEIQHALLPREVPQVEGYDVASLYRSAKEVGGDYFDFVIVGENVLGIAVADVSGKGVPGSLVMTMIRTALRLEARGNRSATDVMAKVNDFVTPDMKKGMFVTMFYIILDSRQRIINFASAGHNPMILYREETDQVYYLKPRGFPLGIDLPDPALFGKSLTQENVRLKQGDLLLVYTDGITEAMNPRREQFGETRLIEIIRTYRHLSSQEFMDKLSEALADFTEEYPQNDDITCVVVKEKMQANEVQVNLRRKLFQLIEEEGLAVNEACRRLQVSTTTYYRLKRLRKKMGDEGVFNLEGRKEHLIQQMSLEERRRLLECIVRSPGLGAKRLAEALGSLEGGPLKVTEKQVYLELQRLHLATREAREKYAVKKKVDGL